MPNTPQRLPQTLLLGFGLLLGLLALAYLVSLTQLNRLHNEKILPPLGKIADFTLTNQDGKNITLADLTNHVWVADIIFTRCASSCPIMSSQMKSLQAALPSDSPAKLVTLTCDPSYDTPPILEKYGQRYDADFHRWMFLTGTPKELSNLATGSLKFGVTPVSPQQRNAPTDFFVHSTIFVVVGKHAQLRGIFQTEGQDVNWTKIKPQILAVVKQLEGE
ncbi:MAG: SCO family protein [Limisphaerales bacterium]